MRETRLNQIYQWCTGSGFWSPIRPDIKNFWIWNGLDIASISTGSGTGLSDWINRDHAKKLDMEY